MTNDHGTPNLERPVARVTVVNDAELLPATVDFVQPTMPNPRPSDTITELEFAWNYRIVPLLAEYYGQPRLTPVGSGPEPTT